MLNGLRYARIWAGVGWLAVIGAVALSLTPRSILHGGSLNDKFEHAAGYAVLAVWFCGIYPRSRYWVIAAGFLCMGITIEALQSAMHWGRQGDVHDIYANAAGIALAVVLAWTTPLGRWARHAETLLLGRQLD